MHQAKETPERPRPGRFHRARALYRNVSKRRTAWLLIKDTVNSCMEYRILGLAAEAAFFTLLSVPPLLLSMIGLLGYVDDWTGADTIASLAAKNGRWPPPANSPWPDSGGCSSKRYSSFSK